MVRIVIVIFYFFSLVGCGPYPRDPNDSLQKAQNHILKAGASESAPWIEFKGDKVTGTEAELVDGFARSIGAKVEWIKGSEGVLMKMLEANELHLVVGGITAETPWRSHVALTRPYYKQQYLICSTSGSPLPKTLDDHRVATLKRSPLSPQIKDRGGIPERLDSLADYRGLIAIPASARDHYPCGKEQLFLTPSEHVMALPMGENALLMAIEKFLNEADH